MNKFICIVCPKGCNLSVDENGNITGNSCKRGAEYGMAELTNPTRTITSTVKIESEILTRLPVMTEHPVPKRLIFDVMREINKVTVKAPIKIKDVIIENVLGLNINIIATRTIDK